MEIVIREMTEVDVPVVVDIIRSHVAEDGRCAARDYGEYFSRARGPREKNYVAIDSAGMVTGVCGYGPDKYDTYGILWINWFYVDESYLGRGIGYKLLNRVLQDVVRLGTRKLCLDTSDDEAYRRAVEFYGRAGFSLVGKLEKYYGQSEAMLIFSLDVDSLDLSIEEGRGRSSKEIQ